MNFNIFTKEQLTLARIYAAEYNLRYAKDILRDIVPFAEHVTKEDKQGIYDEQIRQANQVLKGESDHNFTIMQRMYYFLTGECVALLP
tara:strand:+ start:319 stop:582 length:264 start_codon:yes stop_codon:yes gene_type:complete